MPLHEIDRMDAASLAGAMRRRELSPVEVTARSLERLEETASALNAFAAVDRDGAMAQARDGGGVLRREVCLHRQRTEGARQAGDVDQVLH